MSWLAYAAGDIFDYKKKRFRKKEHRDAFRAVTKFARIMGNGLIACSLDQGSISTGRCKRMLEWACSTYCYGEWSEQNVKYFAQKANWDFDYSQEYAWAYWSARMFLEICAELQLPIKFCY